MSGSTGTKRCDPATTGRPARPGGKRRSSGATRWRVLVLVLVHVAFGLHLLHLRSAGATVSPLEPSESMQLADRAIVNAGLIFFALTIGATLVFGRFFCGWGCHLLALQDLCYAALTKLGVRPKPLRSRALAVVPFLAAAYMFAWPLVYRIATQGGLGFEGVELTTSAFWETFPGPVVAVATLLVCGFGVVWFLGAKGFCAYACPYGALYTVADKVAPGRIRVDDSCDACGHCTAACTSNVAVAQEVRDWGMVVDTGCMKCLDCVSVCPQGALSFGFGRPALGASARSGPRPAKASQVPYEEVFLALVFAGVFFAVRGVWLLDDERMPFLFALGVAGCLAPVYLAGLRLRTRPRVTLQSLVFAREGRPTGLGRALSVVLVLLTALLVHTGVVRWHEARAAAAMGELEELTTRWFEPGRPSVDGAFLERVEALARPAEWLDRYALVEGADNRRRRTWVRIFRDDLPGAEAIARDGLREHPGSVGDALLAGDLAALRGDGAAALEAYEAAIAADPEGLDAVRRAAPLLVEVGRAQDALDRLGHALEAHPDDVVLLLTDASVALVAGTLERAEDDLRHALEVAPERPEPRAMLAQMLAGEGRMDEARALLDDATVGTDPALRALRAELDRLR